MTLEAHKGLEDIIAAETQLTFIDGKSGKLLYRGYDIADLAENSTFEEVAYLLWFGSLPNSSQLGTLTSQLSESRNLPKQVLEILYSFPKTASTMSALRTAVSALSMYDEDESDNSESANRRKSVRLTAQSSTIVASFERIKEGKELVPPDNSLGHAANFLHTLTGREPDERVAKIFDICLILHADHGLNASTFAARVAASTLSDMHSAIVAAIGTLKGPLHGGANAAVMKMLEEIGSPDKAQSYIKQALAQKRRIMGFGHRVYNTEDPRATVLRRLSREIGERNHNLLWYQISEKVDQAVKSVMQLYPNVDFFSASTYRYLGLPSDLFTPIFACSRVVGWSANVIEQYKDNRLIRPEADYVGPPLRKLIPIEQRA
jgi:citrate synthase